MDISGHRADEKTKDRDKADDWNVEYVRWHSDAIFFFVFLHSNFEFGVLNIQLVAEFTDQAIP